MTAASSPCFGRQRPFIANGRRTRSGSVRHFRAASRHVHRWCVGCYTLFLAGPISYDGLLVQCAGRVIRAAPGKDVVEVHDYHDRATPILAASLKRRMPGYRTLGFNTT
jgi:hypothetical protein